MRVLIVGGAGYVGTIIRPALMDQHDCRCFDRTRVDEMGDRSIIGDVNDLKAVRRAVQGVESIIYLPMGGVRTESDDQVADNRVQCAVGAGFDVHVQGFYRFLWEGLAAGIRNFVYVSTLSVFDHVYGRRPLEESAVPDSWGTYSVTKQLGEQLGLMAARQCPEATIVILRIMRPLTVEEQRQRVRDETPRDRMCLGPEDIGRLFLAAVACQKPGAHVVHASGDREGGHFSHARATELLGWRPTGA